MNYSELREKIRQGTRFSISFEKRELKLNGKKVDITDNEDYDKKLNCPPDVILHDAATLYYPNYKCSIPSERSEKHYRGYFKAKKYEDLTDADMVYGERREVARFDLEFYILRALQLKKLTWNDEWGSWFWQDPHDKDFVILREWVEPQQEK